MDKGKVKVLITEGMEEEGLRIFEEQGEGLFEVDVYNKISQEELLKIIEKYDCIVVRSGTKVTAEVIEKGKNLKVIARAGVGLDNIDLQSATNRGIVVINAPTGNTISTAEHTMALMLALARKIPWAHNSVQEGKWERKKFQGVELFNKTLGIIGLGKIGMEVAKRALGFGMKVIAYDPFVSEEKARMIGVQLVDKLDDLYKQADIITVHVPLNEKTKNLITKREISKMKDGVMLINCARGGIINEEDLAEALKSGKVAGAAVDVYSQEPPPPDHPLLHLPNCITVPHLGASTEEAQKNVAIETAQAIVEFFKNGVIMNAVNVPPVDKATLERLKGYLNLGEKLGSFVAQIIENEVDQISILYAGKVAEENVSIITRAIIKGFLENISEEQVTYVNSPIILSSRGIKLIESKEEIEESSFNNLISIRVKEKGKLKPTEVWGVVYDGGGKIVKYQNYFFELDPEGIILMVKNKDKPGVIGYIGTVLGNHNINIAELKLAREKKGENAIMFITVDVKPMRFVIEKLLENELIEDVKIIEL